MRDEAQPPPSWQIALAFAALYVLWGSTYLAIKVAIESMPPLLMASARFAIAGAILLAWASARRAAMPTRAQWRNAAIVGALLIAGGNGLVTLAERWIDSSAAALIIASNPLMMTLLGWWGGVQKRPDLAAWLSLLGGFVGMAALVASGGGLDWSGGAAGYALVFIAIVSWTGGSIFSKRNPQTIDPWLMSGMQMICGAGVLLVMGTARGEWAGLELAATTARSWWGFGYLVVFGSLAGFTSYVFLLRHCSPAQVSSHAYVNPVVAVFLGWLILGETLGPGGWLGAALIVLSVFALLRRRRA